MNREMKDIYFFGHVYVSCSVENCDLNIFVKHEHIKTNNTTWIDENIKCKMCKKLVSDDYESVLDNIRRSKTLNEYKKKEKETIVKKINIYGAPTKDTHKCELDMYLLADKYAYKDICKHIVKSAT
jgi:hypothetical protein